MSEIAGYHPSWRDRVRRRTRRRLLERLGSLVEPTGARLLDLGGGSGVTTTEFGKGACELVVLEPDERKTLRGKRAGAPVTFVNGVAESIPFEEARFERVVSLMSFHHFSDGEQVCREVARVLVPGGRFVIYDIRRASIAAGWLSLFVRRHGHTANVFVNPERLEEWLSAAGLRPVRREPFRSGTFLIAERERADRAAKPI